MMKMKYIFLLIGFALIVGTGYAFSQNANPKKEKPMSAKVQQMIKYFDNEQEDEANDILINLSSKEKTQFAKYLEEHSEKFSPFYFIIMADHIYKSDKDKAVLWYHIGYIRAYQDVKMCVDTTAQSQLGLYPTLAPKTTSYLASKTGYKRDAYMNDILKKALDWDISHPDRVSPIWACYHGIGAFSSEPKLRSKSEYEKIKKQSRDELLELINEE